MRKIIPLIALLVLLGWMTWVLAARLTGIGWSYS